MDRTSYQTNSDPAWYLFLKVHFCVVSEYIRTLTDGIINQNAYFVLTCTW